MVRIGAECLRAAVALGLAVVLLGQDTAQPTENANEGLMDAAVHLVKVGRFDEAAAALKRVMATNPTPEEALRLRNRAGYDFLAPLMPHPQLGEPVRELMRLAFEAMRANRTNPEYIAEMITLLGTGRDAAAVAHLRACGPYAVPALVAVLQDRQQAGKHQAVQSVLTQMPAEAAPAMVEALRAADVAVAGALADALGQMRSRLALAELKRLSEDPRLDPNVRVRVDVGIRGILGREAWGVRPAVDYHLELARGLHHGLEWALPPSTSDTLPLWTWDASANRLTSVEVPRGQYAPLMAVRTVERLVGYWPGHEPAYPMWYLARLGELWEAEARPDGSARAAEIADEVRLLGDVLGDSRLLAGLRTALDQRDYRAARGFLGGLERVARARAVAVDQGVVEALQAPDRGVRYEAALVVAAADPDRPFAGSELVVPVLAEALGQAAYREIVAVVPDLQVVNRFRTALREAGFVVRDVRTSREGLETLAAAPAAELVILDATLADPSAEVFVRQLRGSGRTRALPVLVVAHSAGEESGLETGLILRYPYLGVLRNSASPETVKQRAAAAVAEARGGTLPAREAQGLARRSAQALLAIAPSHPVFRLQAAGAQAAAALRNGPEELRVAACALLGRIGDPPAQEALLQAAAQPDTSVPVRCAALEGLVHAVRSHGSALDPQKVKALGAGLAAGVEPEVIDLTARLIGMVGVDVQDLADTYRRLKQTP